MIRNCRLFFWTESIPERPNPGKLDRVLWEYDESGASEGDNEFSGTSWVELSEFCGVRHRALHHVVLIAIPNLERCKSRLKKPVDFIFNSLTTQLLKQMRGRGRFEWRRSPSAFQNSIKFFTNSVNCLEILFISGAITSCRRTKS